MELVLDKAAILARLGGDEELFAAMVESYLEDTGLYSDRIAAALAAGDAGLLQREVHTIKSLLAGFADEAGAGLARAVEQRAKEGDLAGLDGAVADLQARLHQLAARLREEARLS